MDELRDMVNIAFSQQIRKIDIVNRQDADRDSQYFKLADGVLKGKFSTDTDAAQALFGKPATHSAYKMLKKRLKERLMNTLLFLKPRDTDVNSYSHQYYECYKQMVIGKMLLNMTINKLGFKIIANTMHKALPLELFDVIQQCALALRRKSMLEENIVRFQEYDEIFKDAGKKLMAEAKAEQMNHEILVNFSQSLVSRPELTERLDRYKSKMEKLKSKCSTFLINYYYYYISVVYHQLNRDFKQSVRVSAEFEDFIKDSGIFYSEMRFANTLIIKLDACLLAKDYEQGALAAERAFEIFPKGHVNWFKLHELYFLLCLNTAKLSEASHAYVEVTRHALFNRIAEQDREIWRVYGGYLWFLLGHRNLQSQYPKVFGEGHSFRISSLLNDMPQLSKDKRGFWAAVLILQILLFLQKEEYTEITRRIEALRLYGYRYLTKEDAYRSHYFIRMLIVMEKCNFEAEKTKQQAAKYQWKMMEGFIHFTPTPTQLEIIPYEDLWAMILDMLSTSGRKPVRE